MDKRLAAFERLLNIMDDLRTKCPWDKKQTLESLRYLTIEETYELSDAILKNDLEELKGEIGDLMLHMVFYSKIASEQNAFNITDVLESISDKLVRRHPHIYADIEVTDEEEVKRNWEQIKLQEKGRKTVLQGVPISLPALVKANRIQEKVRGVGFDWEQDHQVWDKVKEEINELEHEVASGAAVEKIENEFGDVLFSLVNYARHIGINPEDALERTNQKFTKRFNYLEAKVKAEKKQLNQMTLEEMDIIWEEAKKRD